MYTNPASRGGKAEDVQQVELFFFFFYIIAGFTYFQRTQ